MCLVKVTCLLNISLKSKHIEKYCIIIMSLCLHKYIDQYFNQIKIASFFTTFPKPFLYYCNDSHESRI